MLTRWRFVNQKEATEIAVWDSVSAKSLLKVLKTHESDRWVVYKEVVSLDSLVTSAAYQEAPSAPLANESTVVIQPQVVQVSAPPASSVATGATLASISIPEPVVQVAAPPVSVQQPVAQVSTPPVVVQQPVAQVSVPPVAVQQPVAQVSTPPVVVQQPVAQVSASPMSVSATSGLFNQPLGNAMSTANTTRIELPKPAEEISLEVQPEPQKAKTPPPMPTSPKNRRNTERFPLKFRVILACGKQTFRTYSSNVSLGGMLLKHKLPTGMHDQVCQIFIGGVNALESLEMRCRILTDLTNPSRLCFVDCDPASMGRLENWIAEAKAQLLKQPYASSAVA